MDSVRVGMIGAGAQANFAHYPSLAEFTDVEIAAVCDLDVARLTTTSERYGVERRYTDYKEMIDGEKLDAVYIIMPPHHLYDPVINCLKKGLDVFIEKPPGITLDQTRNMAVKAEKNGCKTMVAFNRRFIPLMRKVREVIEVHGPLIQCIATFYKHVLNHHPYYNGAVDILTCDAVHAVDTLRWMGGEVQSLSSVISSFYVDYENSFNAVLRFKNGASGLLITNWVAGKRVHTFEMHAKGISAFIDPDDRARIYADNKEEPHIITAVEAAGSDERFKYYGFYAENRHFIDCIKEDRQPETNFRDAEKTMELVKRIYEARM